MSEELNSITVTKDMSAYYSTLAKNWAVKTDGTVDGAEFSSKYYAEEAKSIIEGGTQDIEEIKSEALAAFDTESTEVLASAEGFANSSEGSALEAANAVEAGKQDLNEILAHVPEKFAGFGLFDTKVTDHVLTGDEAVGWAIQGSLVSSVYTDAVDKIVNEYQGGAIANFLRKEAFTMPAFTANTTNGITVSDARNSTDAYSLINGVAQKVTGNFSTYWFKIDFGFATCLKSYFIKADSQGNPEYPTAWTLEASIDGENWDVIDSQTAQVFTLGEQKNYNISSDSVYKQYKIVFSAGNTSGELSRLGFNADKALTFPYKQAVNGHKIANIVNKEQVDKLFQDIGIADFYILDEASRQFYLPRNKWFAQFTDDSSKANEFVEAGLPNITGLVYAFGGDGKLFSNIKSINNFDGGGYAQAQIGFDASKSNPIYGKSDTVQPPASLKLLYYKVGNTVVNEELIDVGNIISDVSNLQNNKADTNLANTEASQSFIDKVFEWFGLDFSRAVSQSNNIEYTAPFAGCVYYYAGASYQSGTFAYLYINDIANVLISTGMNPGCTSSNYFRVNKGDKYKSYGGVFVELKFIPFKGAK